jgi:hypothetical protein
VTHAPEDGLELVRFIVMLVVSECPQIVPGTADWQSVERLNINQVRGPLAIDFGAIIQSVMVPIIQSITRPPSLEPLYPRAPPRPPPLAQRGDGAAARRRARRQGEKRGIANLFACLLTNEEMPLAAARILAATVVGADAGAALQAAAGPDGRTVVNVAGALLAWADKYCARKELQEAAAALQAGRGGEEEALRTLDHGAEAMAVVMAVAGRVWDPKYGQPRRCAGVAGGQLFSGYAAVDQSMEVRGRLVTRVRGLFGGPVVDAALRDDARGARGNLKALSALMDAVEWKQDWSKEMQGGLRYSEIVGLAPGARTYTDIVAAQDDDD